MRLGAMMDFQLLTWCLLPTFLSLFVSQDEAARRRLVKKLYIPLPEYASRMQLLRLTMSKQGVDHRLSEADFESIVHASAGYSGSDMAALCTEASMGPIRHVTAMMDTDDLAGVNANDVRAIEMQDFDAAFQSIRPSVNQKDLTAYVEWNVRRERMCVERTRCELSAWHHRLMLTCPLDAFLLVSAPVPRMSRPMAFLVLRTSTAPSRCPQTHPPTPLLSWHPRAPMHKQQPRRNTMGDTAPLSTARMFATWLRPVIEPTRQMTLPFRSLLLW